MKTNSENMNKMAEEKIVKDTIKDIEKTLKRFEKILMEAFFIRRGKTSNFKNDGKTRQFD